MFWYEVNPTLMGKQHDLSTDKIQKDPSWRCQEKEVLVEGALRHKNVMFSIGDPSVSDVQRYELWEEIADEIYSTCSYSRAVSNIQKKVRELKCHTEEKMDFYKNKTIANIFPKTLDLLQYVQSAAKEGDESLPQMALGICQAILMAWFQKPVEFELNLWLQERKERVCILRQPPLEDCCGQNICEDLHQAKISLCEGLPPLDTFNCAQIFSKWVGCCWNLRSGSIRKERKSRAKHAKVPRKIPKGVQQSDHTDFITRSDKKKSGNGTEAKTRALQEDPEVISVDVSSQDDCMVVEEGEKTDNDEVMEISDDEVIRIPEEENDVNQSNEKVDLVVGDMSTECIDLKDSISVSGAEQTFYCILCHGTSCSEQEEQVRISPEESFSTHMLLLKHIRKVHLKDKKELKCPLCSTYKSDKPRNLLQHINRRHKLQYLSVDKPYANINQPTSDKNNEYLCLFCDPAGPLSDPKAKVFSDFANLKRHISEAHIDNREDEQLIPCPYCNTKVHTTVGNSMRIITSILSHLYLKHKMIFWRKSEGKQDSCAPGKKKKVAEPKYSEVRQETTQSSDHYTSHTISLVTQDAVVAENNEKGITKIKEDSGLSSDRSKTHHQNVEKPHENEVSQHLDGSFSTYVATSDGSSSSSPSTKKLKLGCMMCGMVYNGDNVAAEYAEHMSTVHNVQEELDAVVAKAVSDKPSEIDSLILEIEFVDGKVASDATETENGITSACSMKENVGGKVPISMQQGSQLSQRGKTQASANQEMMVASYAEDQAESAEFATIASDDQENGAGTSNVVPLKSQKSKVRRKIKCPQCSRLFSSQRFLENHQQLHHPTSKDHLCGQCGKTFSHWRSLNAHSWTKHKINIGSQELETCEICGIQELPYAMQKHRKNHGRRNPRNCGICDHHCETSVLYRRHLKTHMVGEQFRCPHCSFEHKKLTPLVKHINSKHMNKEYRCALCSYVAVAPEHLTRHIASTHPTGRRRYYCYNCFRQFANAQTYENHMFMKHRDNVSGRPVLSCPLCSHTAVHKCLLDKHIKTQHQQVIKCPVCETQVDDIDMLNVHMWATHPDVVTACDECGFICESSEVLVVHKLKSHVISEISSELTLDMTASGDNSTAEVLPNTDITVVVENADVTDDSEEQEEEEEDPSETTDVMYACQMCSFVAADISVVSAHLTQVHKVSPEHQPSVAEGDTETILVELDA